MAVLGVDFGNWYGYVSFVQNADENNRGQGVCQNLVQEGLNGIPTVFYYNCIPGKEKELVGSEAVRPSAVPESSRVRLLKHGMTKQFTLPGDKSGRYGPSRTFEYDYAIIQVLKNLIDKANDLLVQNFRGEEASNEIYLAYPGCFGPGEIRHYIDLAEQIKIKDGRNVRVKGTISEPAAAALDFLAQEDRGRQKAVVLMVDLGAGTLDVALVTAYPGGKSMRDDPGRKYYYEIHDVDGDMNAGGSLYDQRMQNILRRKIRSALPAGDDLSAAEWRQADSMAESLKIALTDNDSTEYAVAHDGDFFDGEITGKEFEAECSDLIDNLGKVVQAFYEKNRTEHRPDYIVLSGGAARMPMVRRKLEEVLPEMRGKIRLHNPSRAVSYGAARFGAMQTVENGTDNIVVHSARALGVRYFHRNTDEEYIHVFIPAGVTLPFESKWISSETRKPGQVRSHFSVMEAVTADPDPEAHDRDWREIMHVDLEYGKPVPKGTKSETRLTMEVNGTLTVTARNPENHGQVISNRCQLRNINSEAKS